MTTKNINGREVVFVEVKEDSYDFEFINLHQKCLRFETEYTSGDYIELGLPTLSKYSIIGKASSLSEEQWAGIVASYDGKDDENIGGMIYECFDDSDFTCDTPTQSGLSLLSSLGMKPGTTLLLIKEK